MPRVEYITVNRQGDVTRRHGCGHKHRSLKAAKRCAKTMVGGVPADGGECLAMVYDDDRPVAQFRVFGQCSIRGRIASWRTKTLEIEPGAKLWLNKAAAT